MSMKSIFFLLVFVAWDEYSMRLFGGKLFAKFPLPHLPEPIYPNFMNFVTQFVFDKQTPRFRSANYAKMVGFEILQKMPGALFSAPFPRILISFPSHKSTHGIINLFRVHVPEFLFLTAAAIPFSSSHQHHKQWIS